MTTAPPIPKAAVVSVGRDGQGQSRGVFVQFSQATAEGNRAEAQQRIAFPGDGFVAYRTITW